LSGVFLVPGELGSKEELAASEDREHSRADSVTFLEASPFGHELVESLRCHLTPALQQSQGLPGLLERTEEQADPDDVRGPHADRGRLVAKGSERCEPGVADPVDGARRAPTDLLAAQELDQPIGCELVKLTIESPRAHPAPGLDVHGVGLSAELVAVHRAAFC
jgi:hypothetical protein